MSVVPIFPLGSVLFPAMPLRLRVFEQRYLIMLQSMVTAGRGAFGVVLIERGQEVGGGDHRFSAGTLAEITSLGAQDGFVGLEAQGRARFVVDHWLSEDPYPRAEISELPDLHWREEEQPQLGETEQIVRRTLALASEFSQHIWPAEVELVDDPVARAWQLAGIAPLGPLDQQRLLRAASIRELLTEVARGCTDAADTWSTAWPDAD